MSPRLARRLLTIAAIALLAVSCGGGDRRAPRERAAGAESPAPVPGAAGESRPDDAPLDRLPVTVWFPSASSEGLAGEPREILATTSPADRAKQILSDLISGPTGETALPALPRETRLKQVYVLGDGTAWADFSVELLGALPGGSEEEIRAVYAIVDSLVLNVPEIARVGILVEGKPCENPSGHLDLRRPLPADRSLLEAASPEAPAGQEAPPAGDEPAPEEKPPQSGNVV